MKNSSWTKPLSLLLVVAITLSMCVTSAFAEITDVTIGDIMITSSGNRTLLEGTHTVTATHTDMATSVNDTLHITISSGDTTVYSITPTIDEIGTSEAEFWFEIGENKTGSPITWTVSIATQTNGAIVASKAITQQPTLSDSNSSSSSSSSSGGGGSSGGSTTTTIPQPVTVAQGISAVNSAVNGVATLRNVTEISLSTLQAMVRAAGARGITVNADSRAPDGSIDVRITFNPADATRTINLSASTLNSPAVNARATFAKSFSNTLSTVSLSHTGAFGMNLRVAAKLNPALRNSKNLVFYVYDPATNRYSRLQTTYRIDANGFIHFLTNQSGVVIISDGALKKK